MCTLGVCQLYKVLKDIISTSIGSLIPFLIARIELMQLQVSQSSLGISIELGGPVLVVDGVALEPLLKSHGTHDIIIRHGVEGVKGIFHTFLWTKSHLEVSAHPCACVTRVVEDLVVFKAPGLDDVGIGIIGFNEIVLPVLLVEEENLNSQRGYLVHTPEPIFELGLFPHCVCPQFEFLVIL